MKSSTERPPILSSFKNAAESGTVTQWDRGLDILAEVVSRMEQNTRRSAWGRVGIAFREAVKQGEIVVVGDFGYLAKRGRVLALETSMSAYLEFSENKKDGIVLFIINRNVLDITYNKDGEIYKKEANAINNAVNRLKVVKRKVGSGHVKVDDVDKDSLFKLGLGFILNDLLEDKIRKLDTLE